METTPEFGVLFLGIFVGIVLGIGLAHSKGSLKAGITVVGSALGGGPILYLEKDLGGALWMYPVGLVLGLALLRLYFARKELEQPNAAPVAKKFAMLDVIVISVAALGAAVYASL